MILSDAYNILSIEKTANLDKVKEAYRDLALIWHPDRIPLKNERLRQKATDNMREINVAYELIKDHLSNNVRCSNLEEAKAASANKFKEDIKKAKASMNPNFIRAMFGPDHSHMILIKGDQFISKKLVNIAGKMARSVEFINTLVFRIDGYPKNMYSLSDRETGTVTINLEKFWIGCCEMAQKNDCFISIAGLWTMQILSSVAEQMDRISFSGLTRSAWEAMEVAMLSERAEKFALSLMEDIALQFDIEPGQLADDPMLYIKMTTLFQTRGNEPWVIRQRKLLEDALIYNDPNYKITRYKTLRQWAQMWFSSRDRNSA